MTVSKCYLINKQNKYTVSSENIVLVLTNSQVSIISPFLLFTIRHVFIFTVHQSFDMLGKCILWHKSDGLYK